jgi:hypothetical protein
MNPTLNQSLLVAAMYLIARGKFVTQLSLCLLVVNHSCNIQNSIEHYFNETIRRNCPNCNQLTFLHETRRLYFSSNGQHEQDDDANNELKQTMEAITPELGVSRSLCQDLKEALALAESSCIEMETLHQQTLD